MPVPRDRPAWTDPMPFPGSQKPPFSVPPGTLIKRLKKPRTSAPVQKTFVQGALPKRKAAESRPSPERLSGEMSMKRVGDARRRVSGQGRRASCGLRGGSGIQSAPRHHQPHAGGPFPGLSLLAVQEQPEAPHRRRTIRPLSPGGCRSWAPMPRRASAPPGQAAGPSRSASASRISSDSGVSSRAASLAMVSRLGRCLPASSSET